MPSIRVLLVDMPKLLHDIVSDTIAGSSEIELVGDLADPSELDRAVVERAPDVVVTGADAVEPGPLEELLGGREHVAVLTIDWTGADSRLYDLRRLGEVSTDDLVRTIRTAAGVS